MGKRHHVPVVISEDQSVGQPVAHARDATMAVLLGPAIGAGNFVTRRFVISGGGRIPEHRHDRIEHEQVVVRGEVVMRLDGKEHLVRAGDAVFIPAGCAHSYENRRSEDVEFICVVPNTKDYETEWLEAAPRGAFPG